jgi:hypothetical protein
MKRFCLAIRDEFEAYYMRQPTRADFDKQLAINDDCGFLTDGIYPEWSCFVQSIHQPQDEKRKYFAERQEDVERCFGVLQARFTII